MTRGINAERPFGGRRNDNSGRKGVVIAVSATCTRESDKALLVSINEGPPAQPTLPGFKARDARPHAGDEIWVPKSHVHEDSEVFSSREGEDEGKLIVTQWLASKENWG